MIHPNMACRIIWTTILLLCNGYISPINTETIRINEDQTDTLSCSGGRLLDIKSASYSGEAFFCKKNDVTADVRARCQWKQKCVVRASDTVYDDTCIGPDETLEITFHCIDDCFYHLDGRTFYNGTRSITVSGIICQRWDSLTPHIPKSWPTGEGHENYCRNPDDDEKPWCYTSDPQVRWEYCDIHECESSIVPSTTTTVPLSRGRQESDAPVAIILGVLFGILVTSIVFVLLLLFMKRRGYCKTEQPEVGRRSYVYSAPEQSDTLMGRVRKMVQWRKKSDAGSVVANNPGYSAMDGERIDPVDYANAPNIKSRVYEMPHASNVANMDDVQNTAYTNLYDIPTNQRTDIQSNGCDNHDYEHPEAPKMCTPKPKTAVKPILKKPKPAARPSGKQSNQNDQKDDNLTSQNRPPTTSSNLRDDTAPIVLPRNSENSAKCIDNTSISCDVSKHSKHVDSRAKLKNLKDETLSSKAHTEKSDSCGDSPFLNKKIEEPTYSEKSFMLDKLKQSNSVSSLVDKFNKP